MRSPAGSCANPRSTTATPAITIVQAIQRAGPRRHEAGERESDDDFHEQHCREQREVDRITGQVGFHSRSQAAHP
jgi:hypothetical protein